MAHNVEWVVCVCVCERVCFFGIPWRCQSAIVRSSRLAQRSMPGTGQDLEDDDTRHVLKLRGQT